MQSMKFFIDTHDVASNTFPAGLTREQFEVFYARYEQACADEGVVPLRVYIGYDQGRAFCFTMAPDAEALRRAHARVGLPFDSVTEVTTASPGDTFFRRSADSH